MAEVLHVAATRLVWQGLAYIWVGYDQGLHSQETGGSGVGCGGIFYDKGATQHFKRLPSSSDGRNTTSRALRTERVGRQERPAVRGASRVRVVSIRRRC